MPSTLLIYNPTAGHGRARAQWPLVAEALRAAGVDFDLAQTAGPRHAITLAEQAAQKYSVVVGIGGDGTMHEIVNGLMRASREAETIKMGIIPLGNGDDFAKMVPPETPVGGKPYGWRDAVQKIAQGQAQLFDVGKIEGDGLRPELGSNPHYFLNSFSIGFSGQVALNFTTIPKWLTGMAAYLYAIFTTMIQFPSPHVLFRFDDQPPVEQDTTMTAITNGRCMANGFWVCPDARANDGLFDIFVAQKVSRATILRLIPKIMKGTHTHEPVLRMYRARHATLDSPDPLAVESDGETPYIGAHHLSVELLHNKIPVIV